jgi:beta-phosphoglucomutase family hydrolase
MATAASPGPAPAHPEAVGLRAPVRACLFDLDGVLTQTAKIHAAAWGETFNSFLRAYSAISSQPFKAFDVVKDYELYVDGKPRADGVRDFLASRDIRLPEGTPADGPDAATVHGVGNAKNERFTAILAHDGVEPFAGSVRYLQAARAANLRCAVVTSSANSHAVLEAARIAGYFEAVIDGGDLVRLRLAGKPTPDTYLAAARELGVAPGEAAVFEDALAGVEAGRAGGFGHVVGVDRLGQARALYTHGADAVVRDLGDLLPAR